MYDPATLPNMSLYRARISPQKEAIYDYDNGVRYTYGDLEGRAYRLAWFLTHHLGLHKGDRIGFCASNSVNFIDAFYASCKTGIIITTYNCLLREGELIQMVENEDPKVIFYSGNYREVVQSIRRARGIREYISLDQQFEDDRYSYSDIMAMEPGELPKFELHPDDVQMLIHTGGTTGRPKAAMLTYRSLFYNAISEILTLQLNDADSAYVWLPFFHTAAWNVLTMPLLMIGGRIIITKAFSPAESLKIIRQERPSVGIAVETIYKAMAMHPDFMETDFSCYRWLISGAAPISLQTLEQYWSRGIKLANGYGMTEIGPSNLIPPLNTMEVDDIRKKWSSAGKPMYFNSVRVVDENGRDVAPGDKGELIWRGNLIFSGYWNAPEATKEIYTPDGWVHSGDIGYYDQDGFYYICGRIKNMYISGGENIFPLEIEEIIQKHPDVAECCIIGVPDPKWGEVGKALVVLRPGASLDVQTVQKLVTEELSSIKIPKYVSFVPEIPKNSVGKRDQAVIQSKYGSPVND